MMRQRMTTTSYTYVFFFFLILLIAYAVSVCLRLDAFTMHASSENLEVIYPILWTTRTMECCVKPFTL